MTQVSYCRLCFTTTTDFLKINEEIRGNFYSLTNIHLIKSTIHSNFICRNCIDRLESTCMYVKTLAENETRLMNETKNTKNESDNQMFVTEIKVEIDENDGVVDIKETENDTKISVKCKNRKVPTLEKKKKTVPTLEKSINSTKSMKRNRKSTAEKLPQMENEFPNLSTSDDGKVACSECKRTVFKSNYRKHMERRHLGINNYECDLCLKKFCLKDSMRNHIHAHMNIRPYKCPENCGKSFFSKHGIYFHYKMHHQPLNEFICEICAKKFKQSHLLQEHIDAKHDGIRYKCEYEGCGNLYNTNSALKKHINSIHEYRLEPCKHCGEMFRSGFSLYQHIRINHKQRKYVCEYEGCDKKFVIKTHYTDHLKTHTGMKDFICNICDASYHIKRNLTRHIQVVHQKSRFFCQVSTCNASLCNKDNYRLHLRKVHANLPSPELEKMLEGIAKLRPVFLDSVDGE